MEESQLLQHLLCEGKEGVLTRIGRNIGSFWVKDMLYYLVRQLRQARSLSTKIFFHFYPTALKGCQGIVFTHGVRMGGRPAGKVCPACISETVRCRKLILGRDIG